MKTGDLYVFADAQLGGKLQALRMSVGLLPEDVARDGGMELGVVRLLEAVTVGTQVSLRLIAQYAVACGHVPKLRKMEGEDGHVLTFEPVFHS